MRLIFAKDYEDMSCEAAKIVSGQLYLKPQSVLGLATGSTPIGLYDRLVQVHQTVGLDFSGVTTFNLDEYVGLSSENPESYHYFMKEHLFSRVNLRPDHCFVPNGMAEDLEEEGRRYDALIEQAGGIDLQVLGIGRNAHIGFNEPDIKFEAMTHKVRLDDETIRANARFHPQYHARAPRAAARERTREGGGGLCGGLRQREPEGARLHSAAAPRCDHHRGRRGGSAAAGGVEGTSFLSFLISDLRWDSS